MQLKFFLVRFMIYDFDQASLEKSEILVSSVELAMGMNAIYFFVRSFMKQ